MNYDFLIDRFDWLQAVGIDFLAKKCSKISYNQRRKLAKLLTKAVLPFKFSRKDYVVDIMTKTLGVDHAKAEKLMVQCMEAFLINSFEMASLRYMTAEELNNKIQVEGFDYLKEAHSKGKGVAVICGHFGLWEFLPQWISLQGYTMGSVARNQRNGYVDKWFHDMRNRHGAFTTDSGIALRSILKTLKAGNIIGLMMDQDNGPHGIFMKFLGKWASAPTGPAVIPLKTGCPILPVLVFPNYNGKHILKCYKPIYMENYENTLEGQQKLTQDYNSWYEKIVAQYPEQWFWMHKRWRTQPEKCPDNQWVKLLNIDINETKGS